MRRGAGPYVDWDLVDALADPESLTRIEVLQPLLWAVMVSLAELWRSLGVVPDAVVGSSQGEVAAACVAGALSLADSARIIALRSRLFAEELMGHGAVASVALTVDDVTARLTPGLTVAGINGPSSVTVAGELTALTGFVSACAADDIRARIVPATVASHTDAVDPLRDRLIEALAGIRPTTSSVPVYSTVTGAVIDGAALDAGYWFDNCREPIAFQAAVEAILADGHRVFVETSPHPVLTAAVQDTAERAPSDQPDVVVVGSLRRDDGGWRRFLTSAAEMYVRGGDVNWRRVFDGTGARRTELPTYPFEPHRYWLEPAARAVAADPADEAFWQVIDRADADELARTLGVDDDLTLRELVPALSAWRRRRGDEVTAHRSRYEIAWQPKPDAPTAHLSGTWLVVTSGDDHGEAAADCVAAMVEAGAEVVTVEPERFADALRDVPADLNGVLSFATRDAASTLALVQAVVTAGIAASLWCVTRGAVAVTSAEEVDTDQAQVWGSAEWPRSNTLTVGVAWSTCPTLSTGPLPGRCAPCWPRPTRTRSRCGRPVRTSGGSSARP
ncbi:hypothetical protein GCM10029964_054840 [Kibdelosporangium lantanae]